MSEPVPERPTPPSVDDREIVEDGFGGRWVKHGPDCDLQVVRPGQAQCNCDDPRPQTMMQAVDFDDSTERPTPQDGPGRLDAELAKARRVITELPHPGTVEDLREKITDLFGSPDEALVDAFLSYAWSETARIAGWEMVARWQAEEEIQRLRVALAEASDALCAVGKAALAVAPTLAKPYPDAPKTSPWEQHMEQPARRAYELGARIRRELPEERS